MNTRREFIAAGGLAAAIAAIGAPAAAQDAPASGGECTTHELPPLPYPTNALEPYIDAKTMEIHHGKHHAAYVKGLNEAETALAAARAAGDYAAIQALSKKAAFHGGGHFLHSMFWKVMAPQGPGTGGEPTGDLAAHIARDFGSFAAFKAQFAAAAKAVEGGGWALLHYRLNDGRLVVLQAENQQKLSQWFSVPILGIDVWEHAYYLKYMNDRPTYVDNWWNVVNWPQAAANLEALKAVKL